MKTQGIKVAWLEVTAKCQLICGHCYADSGPDGTHGAMQLSDWERVIGELAGAGVTFVCVIGGEPTMYPDLDAVVNCALAAGMRVEVYSNLVHVNEEQWRVFAQEGVSLATSYYSSDPEEHARIVGRPTLERTTANIEEARRRGIPIRVGMVRVLPTQQIEAATRVLGAFGITRVGVDDLRGVGRGLPEGAPDCSSLCGKCATDRIAITPDGTVYPCVFSRWLPVGNVLTSSIAEILDAAPLAETRNGLTEAFASRTSVVAKCAPDDEDCTPGGMADCGPQNGECNPTSCTPAVRFSGGHLVPKRNLVGHASVTAEYCVPDDCRPSGMADCGPQNGECHPSGCQPNLPKPSVAYALTGVGQ